MPTAGRIDVGFGEVFSTRGVPFGGMYGTLTVDLAQVPLGNVHDQHRHDTASAR